MWWALAVGVVLLVVILVLAFHARSQSKQLGGVARERDELREQVRAYRDASDAVLAPDPTLDELARVSEHASAEDP